MTNRRKKRLEGQPLLALLALVVLIWAAKPAPAQTTPTVPMPNSSPSTQTPDADTRPWQIAAFDKFLDVHPELAEQLHKNPSLINNEEFVENHPALQQYLQQHPGVREEIRENPNAFMGQEARFDQREAQREERRQDEGNRGDRDRDTRQVAAFDGFLDSHPELAEQLRKNPSLVNNKDFVEDHPALQQFLQQHPGIRDEIRENPQAFMRQEQRFDRNEDRTNTPPDRDNRSPMDRDNQATPMDRDDRAATPDRDDSLHRENTMVGARAKGDNDMTGAQLASADRFFDAHPEISEQLTKNPSLINNEEFVEQHPALQQYLQSHPQVREEMKENPNAFMQREARFDRHEDFTKRGEERDDVASFGNFLGMHSSIAQELSKNPSLVNNKEFLESHPELRDYLKTHPQLQTQLAASPETVMNSAQASNAVKGASPKPNHRH